MSRIGYSKVLCASSNEANLSEANLRHLVPITSSNRQDQPALLGNLPMIRSLSLPSSLLKNARSIRSLLKHAKFLPYWRRLSTFVLENRLYTTSEHLLETDFRHAPCKASSHSKDDSVIVVLFFFLGPLSSIDITGPYTCARYIFHRPRENFSKNVVLNRSQGVSRDIYSLWRCVERLRKYILDPNHDNHPQFIRYYSNPRDTYPRRF